MSSDPIPGARRPADDGPCLVATFTLVVWAACVAIGATGLLWQGPEPAGPPPPTSEPAVQVVDVALEEAPTPPTPAPSPAPSVAGPVAAVDDQRVLSPAVAFAVPAPAGARIESAAAAAPAVGPVVRRLTFGQGEGRQPAPVYPSEAVAAGQQGRVVVRLDVGIDGRVENAWPAEPSPFPLLNRSAVAAVRDTWRFPPGPRRAYAVPITFRLNTAG